MILMNQIKENEKQAINYLLGDMAETDRDKFEELLFVDEELSLLLEAAENDLVDEYLRGELSGSQKQKFESNFLVSERRREKLRAAEILEQKMFTEKTFSKPALPGAFWQKLKKSLFIPKLAWAGGLAIVLVLTGIWLFNRPVPDQNMVKVDIGNESNVIPAQIPEMQNRMTVEKIPSKDENTLVKDKSSAGSEISPEKTKTPPRKRDTKPAKPEKIKPSKNQDSQTAARPPKVFAFSLQPPLRSSKRPVLKIPGEARTVRLQLFDNFGEKYVRYLTELNDAGGNQIWSREFAAGQKRPQKTVTVSIPAEKFKNGSYELAVSGITADGSVEEISFYNFVVQKNKN